MCIREKLASPISGEYGKHLGFVDEDYIFVAREFRIKTKNLSWALLSVHV